MAVLLRAGHRCHGLVAKGRAPVIADIAPT
jgi:hypothetical protein